jgi:dethiobiotin synthetase
MVVLDEINIALRYDYLEIAEVVEFLKASKPPMTHVVLTGRNAKDELIEIADLVTEMTLVKHPFRSGIKAQPASSSEANSMARALMIQGAGSDVGKSLIVAGLARAARRRGLSVLPFKPQNMSNNAAVTVDGGEIGRAQALQALAAGVEPHTDMNPVLLKPETDVGAQIIVHGKRIATARAREYANLKPSLMGAVLESFERLKERAGLVLVEGAGSPAEVNLRKSDIANMGFARKADVPVVLIGDIDRGGVIAQLVGIKTVIDAEDAAMIQGFVINKFRGDPTLFDDGYRLIEARTSWRGFGVLPYFTRATELPAEDALGLGEARKPGQCKIAFLSLSRIANFDDLDPLKLEPGVDLVMVRPGEAVPGDARLVIIPRLEIDARRSRLPARAGLGHRSPRTSPPRRPRARRLRRLPDARTQRRRSRGDRRTGGRNRRPRASGCDDGDDRGKDAHPRRRAARRDQTTDRCL